jgi:O-antigen/teichoic acid export membrane protein
MNLVAMVAPQARLGRRDATAQAQASIPSEPEASHEPVDLARHSEHRNRRDRALSASIVSGILAKLVVAIASLASVAITVRTLDNVQFGVIATLSTLTGLMTFADFGIGSGLMTSLAVANGREDKSHARTMVSTAFCGMSALGLTFTLVGIAAALTLPWASIMGAPELAPASLKAGMAAFFAFAGLGVPASLGQRVLIAYQRGTTANLWMLASAISALLCTAVAAEQDLPLWCFVSATLGIPVLISFAQTLHTFGFPYAHIRPRMHLVSTQSFKSMAGMSSLFFGLNIAVAISYQTDALIVAYSLGAEAAAIFAVALRMFALINTTLGSASQQMWTSMAEALARGDRQWVRSRLVRVVAVTATISGPSSVLLALIGQRLANAWVGPSLIPPGQLFVALGIWTVYALAIGQVGLFLNASQIVGPQLVMAMLMTVSNLGLSVLLTERLGITGPVLGSLISHIAFTGIPTMVIARRCLREARIGSNPEIHLSNAAGGLKTSEEGTP